MRLATIRREGTTTAVRVEGESGVDLGVADVRAVLERPHWRDWAATADGEVIDLPSPAAGSGVSSGTDSGMTFAPLVVNPRKIICVGLNYTSHIREMGRDLPEYPTLFAKFAETLAGAHDDIVVPAVGADAVDWEAELAIVIGAAARDVPEDQAPQAIAGYTVLNDISMRDWQNRTKEWLQGKNFEATTPVGPVMVTLDELGEDGLEISADVDGERMQHADTSDLLFTPAQLVSYISQITTLRPGDIIATGTPGGVGNAREPKQFLTHGSTVVTRIEGIGETRNRILHA